MPEDAKQKVKYWYNGYKVRRIDHNSICYIDKYNIWSVVKHLNSYEIDRTEPKSYWEESGNIDFIEKLFKIILVKQYIEFLLKNNEIDFTLTTAITFENFKTLKQLLTLGSNIYIQDSSVDLLFSYLYMNGYLTKLESGKFIFPNEEIRHEMSKRMVQYYKTIYNIDYFVLNDLTDQLALILNDDNIQIDNKLKSFRKDFEALLKTCKFYDDINKNSEGIFANEDSIHSILNMICMQILHARFGTEVITTKSSNGKRGRADVILYNKTRGIVIEVKYNGNVKDALTQAESYKQVIENQKQQIFIGVNITTEKEVQLVNKNLGI